MERKTHYKMYKAGKNWVFAMLSTVALTGVMAMSGNTAKADAVAQSSTEQVAKVDTTGATTTQVEKAINNVNESNAAQTSVTTTTGQSSSNADATSSSQNNKQATTTSVVTSQNTLVANKDQASSIQSSVTQNSKKTETVINTADNASQKNVNGNWYLVDNNTGKNLTGFQEIKYQNKVVYYAPSNAQMQYGWQDINNNRYYFDTFDGAMTTGQKNINGNWYMFDAQGVLQTGFQRIESQNKTVYYSEDKDKLGQMKYGFQNINGKMYYFDTFDGSMKTGQKNINGNWYMFDDKGVMKVGFVTIPSQNKTVYYSEDKAKLGQMQYGKTGIKGKTYYFDTFDGAMAVGEKKIDNHMYLFDSKGIMQIGFHDLDGGKRTVYYSEAKSNYGQMLYGNQVINGKNYYFDSTTGAMRKGILVLDKANHTLSYVTNEGTVAKNMRYKIDNVEYIFNVAGVLEHSQGEANIAGNWYLFGDNNHVLIGFQTLKDGRKVYYSTDSGQMQFGQRNIDGHWYMFDTFNGAMKTGFVNIPEQNKTVYYATNGQMQYGQRNIDGHWYMFDTFNGAMKTGFVNIPEQNKTVYYAANGQMQYGKQNIDGHWYLFNTFDGAMYKGWLMSGNDWYYYNQQNGQLQTGSAVINGVGYNFDGNGKQILNYSIDYRYALPAGKGDDETAANNYIILHDVGKVYQVGRPGQVSWGAGRVANHNAPVQIELGRTYNSWQFWQDYVTYVRVARDMAGKYGIPLTLDAGGAGTRGIKSHYWVTKNIWGDHVDPYGYLSRFGVTQAKLAHDLLYGV